MDVLLCHVCSRSLLVVRWLFRVSSVVGSGRRARSGVAPPPLRLTVTRVAVSAVGVSALVRPGGSCSSAVISLDRLLVLPSLARGLTHGARDGTHHPFDLRSRWPRPAQRHPVRPPRTSSALWTASHPRWLDHLGPMLTYPASPISTRGMPSPKADSERPTESETGRCEHRGDNETGPVACAHVGAQKKTVPRVDGVFIF